MVMIPDVEATFGRWQVFRSAPAGLGAEPERLLTEVVEPWFAARALDGEPNRWYALRFGVPDPQLAVFVLAADGELAAGLGELLTGATSAEPSPIPYRPDLERFGGPAGLAACERFWADAMAETVAAIRANTSRARRLRVGTEILFAAASSSTETWSDTVGWLREHVRAWADTEGLATARVSAARGRAEAGFIRNQGDWLGLPDRLRPEFAVETSPAGRWFGLLRDAWTELAGLQRAGLLDRPGQQVFHHAVHLLLHRQLGLELDDETYLTWLLTYGLSSAGPREPFFTDTVDAADRRLHEQSKYAIYRAEDQLSDESLGPVRGRQQLPTPVRTIELDVPAALDTGGRSLEDVLRGRRSTHGRYTGPLTLAELSSLLYFAAGAVADKALPGTDASYRVRSYPSGGTRYPVRLLLYCHDVTGLERGTYLYDATQHQLDLIEPGDLSEELQQTSPWVNPRVPAPKATGGIDASECPLWIFPIADLTYQRMAYGLRSYRLVLMECGHLAQNLSLVATALGKSCIGIGGYMDDAVNQLMNVDGLNTAVMYLYLVGDVAGR